MVYGPETYGREAPPIIDRGFLNKFQNSAVYGRETHGYGRETYGREPPRPQTIDF